MFYVYVLRSESDLGFYIGYSADLKRRLWAHKRGGAQATSYRAPWKLIYYEAYLEREDALGRERYLKSGSGRKFLKTQLRRYLDKNPFAA
jgi:putative endonuclease